MDISKTNMYSQIKTQTYIKQNVSQQELKLQAEYMARNQKFTNMAESFEKATAVQSRPIGTNMVTKTTVHTTNNMSSAVISSAPASTQVAQAATASTNAVGAVLMGTAAVAGASYAVYRIATGEGIFSDVHDTYYGRGIHLPNTDDMNKFIKSGNGVIQSIEKQLKSSTGASETDVFQGVHKFQKDTKAIVNVGKTLINRPNAERLRALEGRAVSEMINSVQSLNPEKNLEQILHGKNTALSNEGIKHLEKVASYYDSVVQQTGKIPGHLSKTKMNGMTLANTQQEMKRLLSAYSRANNLKRNVGSMGAFSAGIGYISTATRRDASTAAVLLYQREKKNYCSQLNAKKKARKGTFRNIGSLFAEKSGFKDTDVGQAYGYMNTALSTVRKGAKSAASVSKKGYMIGRAGKDAAVLATGATTKGISVVLGGAADLAEGRAIGDLLSKASGKVGNFSDKNLYNFKTRRDRRRTRHDKTVDQINKFSPVEKIKRQKNKLSQKAYDKASAAALSQLKKIDDFLNRHKLGFISKNFQKAYYAAGKVRRGTKRAASIATSPFRAIGTAFRTGMAVIGTAVLLLLVICIVPLAMVGGNSSSYANTGKYRYKEVSDKVEAHTATIIKYANLYGMEDYVDLIKAVMMLESGGDSAKTPDVMQCSACSFNTRYPNTSNAITDPEYSIDVGIQMLKYCLEKADVTGSDDIEHIALGLQGYNYGTGYISWAKNNYGGYSYENAQEYSDMMQAKLGTSRYGSPEYVPLVFQYYGQGLSLFATYGYYGVGSTAIVELAKTYEGQTGYQCGAFDYMGFEDNWCAGFVCMVADQLGYIDSGVIPNSFYTPTSAQWFQDQGRWQDYDCYTPQPGDIVYFYNSKYGRIAHVAIVESVVDDDTIRVVEGNTHGGKTNGSYYESSVVDITDYPSDGSYMNNLRVAGYGIPDYMAN